MKKAIAFAGGVVALAAAAGASISYSGGVYSENFDGLQNVPTPFSATTGVQVAIPGVSGWEGTRWSGSSTTAMPYVSDNGASATGGIRNLGATGDSDRALGGLASGTNRPAWGAAFTNDGSEAIDSFTVSFDVEEWRRANGSTAVVNTTVFAWGLSTDGVLASDFLTSALMTLDSQGDLVSMDPIASTSAADVIANTPFISMISFTISGIDVPVGETIYLRWQEVDNTGNDAALAIDNFSFRATFVPSPGAAFLLGMGGLLIARRRR